MHDSASTTQSSRTAIRFLVGIAAAASLWGAYRALTMDDDPMPGHSMPGSHLPAEGAPKALMGMPLSSMPEMFVAGAAVLALMVVLWSSRGRRRTTAAVGDGNRLQMVILTAALAVDVSKTSSLGFVIPGLRKEYGLAPAQASLLAVAGLTGTMVGALAVRWAADRISRRDIYLLAAVGFTVTSACAMMPNFRGNLVMCFLMGITVGGLAPMLVAALRDCARATGRGGAVVTASIMASAVGFLIASGSAAWLEPTYGWRVLWLVGVPTGLVLALMSPLVIDGAPTPAVQPVTARTPRTISAPLQYLYALLTGVVAFGVSTWTPSLARDGLSAHDANQLLTLVALALVPVAVIIGLAYSRFGPVAVTAGIAVISGMVLLGLVTSASDRAPVILGAVALVGTLFCVNTMSAVFLPTAANLSRPDRRTRVVATVSAFNRVGGLTGPLLLAGLVSSRRDMFIAVAGLAACCLAVAFLLNRMSARAAR